MKILLASNNKGKIAEFAKFFEKIGIELVPQSTLNIAEAVEDGIGFVDNALIKARHAAKYTDLAVLADDSGLIVDGLQGEPGVISARYAGPGCSFEDNINKVITNLKKQGLEKSTARFYCSLVLLRQGAHDPTPLIYNATWEGSVVTYRSGNNGFGYDPIFIDNTTGKSAAEMFAEKQLCSHRALALQKLISELKKDMA
ncbi:MAG: non-canonical purine NTP pyrophosphatase [Legionellales bacterium]|nr:non-canonical purine NTP pyrophosphatase [Legionellales bacterium]